MIALAFASPATVLPAFAAWLGAPNVVIGAIPVTMRGRFFAVTSVVASIGGLGAGAVAADLLGAHRPAVAYALCFLYGAACLLVSFVALALVREPAPATTATATEPLGAYLR